MWGRKQGIQDFFNRNGARFTAITEAGSNGPISHGATPLAQARYPLMRRLPRGPASGHRPQAQGRDVPWRGLPPLATVRRLAGFREKVGLLSSASGAGSAAQKRKNKLTAGLS
jgi:hypothetical protein